MPKEQIITEQSEQPLETPDSSQPSSAEGSGAERLTAIRLVIRIGIVGTLLSFAFNLLLYFETEAWQMLFVVAGELLAIVCLLPARRLARRGRFDLAGYWILLAVSIAFGGAELVHSGITVYLAPGGILLIFLAGTLVLPRDWETWLTAAGLFGAFVLLINGLEPLPRYDVGELGALVRLFALSLILFLSVIALWRLISFYRAIQTIRFRLLISFVALVILPTVAVGVVSGLLSADSAEQRVIAQLESVATLKQAEIQTWSDNLRSDLATALLGREAKVNARVLLQEQSQSLILQEEMRRRLLDIIEETGRFQELFLMDLQGQVYLSTDPTQEDEDYSQEAFFSRGLQGYYVQPPKRDFPRSGQISVMAARPVFDLENQTVGVLAGRASLEALNEIMLERAGLGDTGETYLVDSNYALLTDLASAGYAAGQIAVQTDGVTQAVDRASGGSGVYGNYEGDTVIGVYRWLPDLRVVLMAEQAQSEALESTFAALSISAGVTLLALVFALAAGWWVTRSIATPLASLAETATQIAGGDLEMEAQVGRQDEIGALAKAFNSMTAQLLGLIGGLEERIAERTQDLRRRSVYLEAAAEVSQAAASILDTDPLIRQVVRLIRDRFDLYYVGLFLVDESGEWAVLRAGTGEAGRVMLERGHRIRVGEGMVGWSVANVQARIASKAEADAVRLVTSELPDTRSEAALPLRSRGRVLGALTVQDDVPDAFDEDIINVLQTMADQVAVALDNARLFTESQELLEAERRAYGEASREAWRQIAVARPDVGYLCDEHDAVNPISHRWKDEMVQAGQEGEVVWDGGATLALPIKIRERVEGVIRLRKPDDASKWTKDEIELMETLADQLSAALESARLYRDTQRRAVRDRLISDLTARMRETLDVEIVLETAVEGIGETLELEALDALLLESDTT